MSNSLECRWLLNSSKTVSEVPGALQCREVLLPNCNLFVDVAVELGKPNSCLLEPRSLAIKRPAQTILGREARQMTPSFFDKLSIPL
jgi:hypothetical protein